MTKDIPYASIYNAKLIDLSREIHHKAQRPPTHPSIEVFSFATHDEVRVADGYGFSCATMGLHMGDHAGTHVDAPSHFDKDSTMSIDAMPLSSFFTEALCLDLSHLPDESDITCQDLALAEEKSGSTIQPRDTVLLYTGFHDKYIGKPEYLTKFSGLTKESATWLGKKGITMFGVEAISPGRLGRNNFEVHHVCRDLGFTHMECLRNLDALVGIGRFRFMGFPLRIRQGTGSPIRAVAWIE